jgi:hypothetical protein
MKKKILTLVAFCAAMTVNATILRVSNVSGSTAPYSTIQAACDAANPGDTIMVDGSPTSYGNITIAKRLVLIGPGYLLLENEIVDEAAPSAQVNITLTKDDNGSAAGTVVTGFSLNSIRILDVNNCIVKRNYFTGSSSNSAIDLRGDNSVIHQNLFNNYLNVLTTAGTGYYIVHPFQFTNNIVKASTKIISGLANGYIAYNTLIPSAIKDSEEKYSCWHNVVNSTFEHNIMPTTHVVYSSTSLENNNEYSENYIGVFDVDLTTLKTDKNVQTVEKGMSEGKYGAFAGDSPYVISGLPAAPVIEDLIVPTSVETGSKISVTIKVGVQK